MNWLQIVLWGLAALFALDSTLGRWLLPRFVKTFRMTERTGGMPGSGRLVVYLPGTLFDGDESVAEVLTAFLRRAQTAMFISYGFWRFLPKHVLRMTAESIGQANGPNQRFTRIVLFGASFGGRLAADLRLLLITEYGWSKSSVRINMDDTPCENNSFQMPGFIVSLILKRVYVGPLISLALMPVLRRVYVPPMEGEIQEGLDFARVKKLAVDRMAKFALSAVCDQQRYLADNSVQWTIGLRGAYIFYIMDIFANVTVLQPAALRKIELYLEGAAAKIDWATSNKPHCGFLQLPSESMDIIDLAIESAFSYEYPSDDWFVPFDETVGLDKCSNYVERASHH